LNRIRGRLQQLRDRVQQKRGCQITAHRIQGGPVADHQRLRLLAHHPHLRQCHLHLHVLQLLLERAGTTSARSGPQEHSHDHLHVGGDGETGLNV